eukprot:SAG11_NODE_4795_length_1764_cov_1.309910_2_plen_86_part_00
MALPSFVKVVNELNGSVEESRMCRMGAIFSLLAMVNAPAGTLPVLRRRLADRLDGTVREARPTLPTTVDVRTTEHWARPTETRLR